MAAVAYPFVDVAYPFVDVAYPFVDVHLQGLVVHREEMGVGASGGIADIILGDENIARIEIGDA